MRCIAPYLFFLIALNCSFKSAYCQSNPIDSLKLALKNAKHDTTRCNILNAMVEAEADDNTWPLYNDQLLKLAEKNNLSTTIPILKICYSKHLANAINNLGYIAQQRGNPKKAIEYYDKSLKTRETIDDKSGIATSLNNIAQIYANEGAIDKAIEYHHKSLRIREQIHEKIGIAMSLNNLGYIFDNQGDIPKALEFYHKSLAIKEEINDKRGMAESFINLGLIYSKLNDTTKALEYYQKSLALAESIQDKRAIAFTSINLGSIYKKRQEPLNALVNFKRSLALMEQIQDKKGIANALTNIGLLYNEMDSVGKALQYHHLSLRLSEEMGEKDGMAYTLNFIADLNLKKGLLSEALIYANKSLAASKEIGYPQNIQNAAEMLKKIYQKQKQYKPAYEMYELEIKMRDSINNQETQKATIRKQMQYDYDKKELLIKAEQDKKDVIAKEELVQKEKERNYFIIGFILVMVLALFIFRGYRQKQKDNKLITQQKHLVDEKQKEILDSIRYAKRIQTAVMTNENYIGKTLNKLQKDQ